MSGRAKLSVFKTKRREISRVAETGEQELPDLEGMIVSGIGSLLYTMGTLASGVMGRDPVTVNFGETQITLSQSDVTQNWCERLNELVSGVDSFAEKVSHGREHVIHKVLEADGWRLTKETLRIPVWLDDHCEVPVRDVFSCLEDSQWLEQYLSATM